MLFLLYIILPATELASGFVTISDMTIAGILRTKGSMTHQEVYLFMMEGPHVGMRYGISETNISKFHTG